MLSDPAFWAAAAAAILIAGVSKGGFGGGVGFMATPLLALASSATLAVAVMLPILAVMDLTGLWAYRGKWDWRNARALMASSLIGIGVAALLFHVVNEAALRIVIGLTALVFVAHRALWPVLVSGAGQSARPFRAWSAALWGTVAGFTSFVAHAGGPAVAMHMLPQRPDKTTYQATSVIVFWWINLAKMTPYFALGLFTRESLTASLAMAPFAPLGFAVGVWAHRHVSERWFYRIAYIALTVIGARLIWLGLADL